MSDFNERMHDLLKYLTKVGDVSKKARDEINNYLKLEKCSDTIRKEIKKNLINLTNNLFDEVANLKEDIDLTKLDTFARSKNKSAKEDTTSQLGKEVKDVIADDESSKKHPTEENKENENETTNGYEAKPVLKIVDFSKLVDPRNLELMDKNHKRKQKQNKISVIVLSSSDEEVGSEAHSIKQKLTKTVSLHPNLDNKKPCDKSETSTKKPVKNSFKSQGTETLKSINLSRSKEMKKLNNKNAESVNDEVKCILMNDKRFKKKAYVKLCRVPCEEMKEFYSKNIMKNKSNVDTSKLRKEKQSAALVLDEKTGEMINLEFASEGRKEPEERKASEKTVVTSKKGNESSQKKSRGNDFHKSTKDRKKTALFEKLDLSENKQSKTVSRRKEKLRENPETLNSKRVDNFETERNDPEIDIHSNVEENETNQSDQCESSNEILENCNNVSKNVCDILEVKKKIIEANSTEITEKQPKNKIVCVLPVPLSDSETEYSHEQNSNESEKIVKLVEKKDSQATDFSCGNVKSPIKIKVNESIHKNNLCDDTNEPNESSTKGDTSSTKKNTGPKEKIAKNQTTKTDGKLECKSRKEIRDIQEALEVETGSNSQSMTHKKSDKIHETEEKMKDKKIFNESVSSKKKRLDQSINKQNLSNEEKRTSTKNIQSPCQSDEDMFNSDNQEKNKVSLDMEKKCTNSCSHRDSSSEEVDEYNKKEDEVSISKSRDETNSTSRIDSSNGEEDESNKKENKVSKSRDVKKKLTKTSSRRDSSSGEEDEPREKESEVSKSRGLKKKLTNSTSPKNSSSDEEDESNKKENEVLKSRDVKKKLTKTSSRRDSSSGEEDEPKEKESEVTKSRGLKKKLTNSTSFKNSSSDEDESNKKENKVSKSRDVKKKLTKTSSRRDSSSGEEDEPREKESEVSKSRGLKKKLTNSTSPKNSSSDEEDESNKKENEVLKSRDVKKKLTKTSSRRDSSSGEEDEPKEKESEVTKSRGLKKKLTNSTSFKNSSSDEDESNKKENKVSKSRDVKKKLTKTSSRRDSSSGEEDEPKEKESEVSKSRGLKKKLTNSTTPKNSSSDEEDESNKKENEVLKSRDVKKKLTKTSSRRDSSSGEEDEPKEKESEVSKSRGVKKKLTNSTSPKNSSSDEEDESNKKENEVLKSRDVKKKLTKTSSRRDSSSGEEDEPKETESEVSKSRGLKKKLTNSTSPKDSSSDEEDESNKKENEVLKSRDVKKKLTKTRSRRDSSSGEEGEPKEKESDVSKSRGMKKKLTKTSSRSDSSSGEEDESNKKENKVSKSSNVKKKLTKTSSRSDSSSGEEDESNKKEDKVSKSSNVKNKLTKISSCSDASCGEEDESNKKENKVSKSRDVQNKLIKSSSSSNASSGEEDESNKKENKFSKSRDVNNKLTKTSSHSDSSSGDEDESNNKENKVSKSRDVQNELTKTSSCSDASSGEEDESNKKENKVSKSRDVKKKLTKTRSRRDSSSGEEDESNKKEDKVSKSSNVKKKLTKTSSRSDSSSDEEDQSNKKGNEVSSNSDKDKKRKRSGNESSEKDEENNSDDSEDFGAFYKNKLLRSRQSKKRKIKGFISDSEEDDELKKSKNSESECENNKSSELSGDNSSGETKKNKSKTKKRRIIKIKEDSDSSDAQTTRKKIKKVISKNSLSESTKQATAEERERKQRIAEKQKKYNQIYENIDLASSKVDKLVLDIDEETNEPLLEVNKFLVSKLKPHQASGIQFMWDACFESLKRAEKSTGSGCILAHCMGLGKTLQVIALVNTLIEDAEKTKIRKVLVVTPLSTVLNWKAEFKNWLSGREDYDVYELVTCKPQNAERSFFIKRWHKNGGVMIMSYSMFRNLSSEKNKKINKKIRDIFTEGLVDPGPDLVICDEGHLLKNEKSSISIAMNKIKTQRRIVLTGTPLQNNLKEYYCMVQFVKPNLLGTYKEYMNRFVNPITNGQYIDSTPYDINIMRRRSHVLHKLLDGIVQRRDYGVLSPYLPPKFEYILFLTLTDTQKKLYSHYLENFSRKSKDPSSNRGSLLFQDFQAFSRICIHPRVLLDKSVDDQNKYQTDEESAGSLKNFVVDGSDSTSRTGSSESDSGDESEESDKKRKKRKKSKRVTRSQKSAENSASDSEDEDTEKEWWQQYCDGDELDNLGNSSKLLVLFEILKECEQIGDKVLVFSQSLYALNVIEYFLGKVDEATKNGDADEKTCGFTGSWTPGLDYFRLDGSTNCSLRSSWCKTFNKEGNTRARLFLLSTKAGGLGINLVGANRVIIFDVSWNPSSDLQSIYRVYRFGQLKPSYIYRFVIYGTMEMTIYERQVTKQAISKRVIDEQQIDRHYNQNDLTELYKFDQPSVEDRPIPLVPQDVLLAELLQKHENNIFKYHEHQSLLENKEDETLNEDERKAAWEEFENEKVERTKQVLIGKFSVGTVQLALKNIIKRDNPTWNNSQILSIIPQLIQQLNIQLAANDMTMYNRIAAEIKMMQEEYTRKMQMQFYQYNMQMEAQRQQQLGFFGSQAPPFGAYSNYQPHPRFMHNPGYTPPVPSTSTLNANDIVEIN